MTAHPQGEISPQQAVEEYEQRPRRAIDRKEISVTPLDSPSVAGRAGAGPGTDSKPLFISVIVPVRNEAESIGRVLAELVEQKYDPERYESIVVDGESTDGTIDLIRQYSERHLVRWVSEPDSGTVEATSKGLRMASGDIVVLIPSDDLIFPWSVATAVSYYRTHPEVEVVHGDSLAWDLPTGAWSLRFHKRFTYGYLARTQTLTPQATYLRRHVLLGNEEFDPSLPHVCDYDWIMRVTRGRKVVNIPEFLAIFRKRPGAINLREGASEQITREDSVARARYIGTSGPIHWAMVRWDRVYGAIHRRIQICRIVRYSRRAGEPGNGLKPGTPWRNFLTAYSVSGSSPRELLATLLPGRRRYGVDIWSRPDARNLGAAARPRETKAAN